MTDLKTGERQAVMGTELIARSGELAIGAAAARAKAEAEAGYIVALKNPRDIHQARLEILEACKRPRFAESARYRKKVGDTHIVGPSIRFTEVALQALGNIRSSTTITYEDDQVRCLNITVTDYEKNLGYGKDVTLTKTVERSGKVGREVVSERINTKGKTVYIVIATEDEMQNKAAAAESKIIRNSGLRLVPQDIIDEAMEQCVTTISGQSQGDPVAYRNKWLDAFVKIGVTSKDLEAYLAHKIELTSPDEWADLAGIHAAIKSKEAKWSDYVESRRSEPEMGTFNIADLRPSEPKSEDPPLDVTPEKTIADVWNEYIYDLEQNRKLTKDGKKAAIVFLGEEYGTTDLKKLAEIVDAPTFQLFTARCTTRLEEDEWIK